MSKKQIEKIMAIDENTLIIGSDIAKKVHYARAQDYRGIEYGKPLKYENSRKGFESLWKWIKVLQDELQKTKIIFGVEPTGHYWFPLAWFLKSRGIQIVLVNPYHVSQTKELDDNSPTKNDIKDAKVIAQLVKDGRYSTPNLLTDIYAEIKVGMCQYQQLSEDLIRIKIRVQTWLDKYFPEYTSIFKQWNGQASLEVLRNIPLPEDVITAGVDNIVTIWKEVGLRSIGIKRANVLTEVAKESIGVTVGLEMARHEIKILIDQYEMLLKQTTALLDKVALLVKEIPGSESMLSIPGLGLVTVAGFLAEVGDVRSYRHGLQIIKLAGLNLKENSSGKHKGKATITKRGRPRLRAIMFRATLSLIKNNPQFRALHNYLVTRSENPLKKKQSIIALCGKLIRVLFTLGCKNISYNPDQFLGEVRQSQINLAA